MSPARFRRLFESVTAMTPRTYAQARRAERVRATLATGASVTRAYSDAGFGSSGRFYEGATRLLGMAPSAFRRGARGIRMLAATGRSSLGPVLVAATERGICSVEIGDALAVLRRRLRRRFPMAEILDGDDAFQSLVERVIAAIDEPSRALSLPLEVRGTAFQHRVWQALRSIPSGGTRTYSEVAGSIGRPRAVRAVARACGGNPAAVLIPCHRVVGADGSLRGYRWGLARKGALLRREVEARTPRRATTVTVSNARRRSGGRRTTRSDPARR